MSSASEFQTTYPRASALLPGDLLTTLDNLLPTLSQDRTGKIAQFLQEAADQGNIPGYLPDLFRLEHAALEAGSSVLPDSEIVSEQIVNPGLRLVGSRWQGLCRFLFENREADTEPRYMNEERYILVWKAPKDAELHCREATSQDLLVLKLVAEDADPLTLAADFGVRPARLLALMAAAARDGLLLRPVSRIRRQDFSPRELGPTSPEDHFADIFTLQWHITQACDLHCKHCYDRGKRDFLGIDRGVAILDDLQRFCARQRVRAQVSFTGGNPLLHPDLDRLIREAAQRGFLVAMLANPTSRQRIQEILEISPISYFQVSLEGLEDHNDAIRGPGHFQRTLEFLDVLQELGVYSTVMLTLTEANMDQVLALGEFLRGRTNMLTFNRLSLVGEGAHLQPADPHAYQNFLRDYLRAADTNPVLGCKDNLLNAARHREGRVLFGGCTGFGCGAAFNFLAVLSDGDVHACRKFPSRLGNIFKQSLVEIYNSSRAAMIRKGTQACAGCSIRAVCGGCPAVTQSHGLDIFRDRDPYCLDGPLNEESRHAFSI